MRPVMTAGNFSGEQESSPMDYMSAGGLRDVLGGSTPDASAAVTVAAGGGASGGSMGGEDSSPTGVSDGSGGGEVSGESGTEMSVGSRASGMRLLLCVASL